MGARQMPGWRRIGAIGLPSLAMLAIDAVSSGATAAGIGVQPAPGLVWGLPFVGLLLSIALFPLLAPGIWHHHYGKVTTLWALALMVPYGFSFGWPALSHEMLHVFLLDYVPFIILITALFTVAGGLFIHGRFTGSPLSNTILLAVGTLLASFVGTTGASMLMIRPLIRANQHREHATHVYVFFIFLVSNTGGALTPLGDPPLFLGFLQGVSFFWPTQAMWPVTLTVVSVLLALFFAIDHIRSRQSPPSSPATASAAPPRLAVTLDGKVNLLLLAALIAVVLWSGVAARTWPMLTVQPGIDVPVSGLVRDALLVVIIALSLALTPRLAREENHFTFAPMIEVAKLFAGIFVTIVPVLAMLRAGRSGAMAGLVELVSHPDGTPNQAMYFWLSGILSSFLDNAPTYLVFFNLAGGDPDRLMGPLAGTLIAISAGSVFMGANSYIGNAPNFMVKAICEERGVKMPSFFGYMVWSTGILVPLFILITFLFFR